MPRTTTALLALLPLLVAAAPVTQNEGALRAALEGTRVKVLIDLPGTTKGVDLYPERDPQVDFRQYGNKLKNNGIAISAGTEATITLIKLKGEHIEFQLDGGGYGTAGDETASRRYIARPSETQREKDLEEEIRDESDRDRKRRLERELRDLKDRRERDYQRDVRDEADRYERTVERIGRARLIGGSRFNVRYDRDVPAAARTAEGLAVALADFVEFPGEVASQVQFVKQPDSKLPPNSETGAPTPLPIFKGMSRADVEAVFGYPTRCAESAEGRLTALVCHYGLGEATAEVTFVNDATVGYVITSQ